MRIKKIVAAILTCSLMGRIISCLCKNRIPFRGLVFDTHIPEISSVTKAELFWKIYESAEIRFIQKYLVGSLDVIELGSSIGIVSALIKKRLGKDARLICVEAHPALSRQIPINLKLNALFENVTCLNKAINYNPKNNQGVFFTPGEFSTTGRLAGGNPQDNSILVETVTLSGLKSSFGINNFTLIADIEGAEAYIIREDKEGLSDCQHLFLELHNTAYSGVSVSAEEMLRELIDIHDFCLQDRYSNVVYLNRAHSKA